MKQYRVTFEMPSLLNFEMQTEMFNLAMHLSKVDESKYDICKVESFIHIDLDDEQEYRKVKEYRQRFADLVYEQEQREKADKMFPNSYTEYEAELVASNID